MRLLLRLLGGLIIGAAVGYGLFLATGLPRQGQFTCGGAIVGVGGALIYTVFRRTSSDVMLAEVKVTIPQFSEVTFLVNSEYRRVAWKLFVETVTRIATQPLGSEQGFVRGALGSLHGLFGTARELLKGMEPSRNATGAKWTVEMLAASMLNQEIRPFLSKWHPILSRFEKSRPVALESEWDRGLECRRELEQVRQRLLDYARGFGELAGVSNLDHFISRTKSAESER